MTWGHRGVLGENRRERSEKAFERSALQPRTVQPGKPTAREVPPSRPPPSPPRPAQGFSQRLPAERQPSPGSTLSRREMPNKRSTGPSTSGKPKAQPHTRGSPARTSIPRFSGSTSREILFCPPCRNLAKSRVGLARGTREQSYFRRRLVGAVLTTEGVA